MPKKYFGFLLTTALVMSIALMASVSDRHELSITSPQIIPKSDASLNKSGSRAVVWDNGMTYVGLLSAQQETDPTGLDTEPADDFMFAADQLVNDVHWIGGYWSGPPDDGNFDWTIRFYQDDGTGTRPGALIATYAFANADVNETWLAGSPGDANYYNYSVSLPSTLTFIADQKYWISIQGQGDIAPQSGWAHHFEPHVLLYEGVIRSVHFGFPDWTEIGPLISDPPMATDLCFQLTYEEAQECHWNPGDPHKMHFPQLPNEAGWDVNATAPMILADDFKCMKSGPIMDVHFWGGWKGDIEGTILYFVLSIHADIPADPPSIPYSRPGPTLWEREVTDFQATQYDPPSLEGWYDPATGEEIWDFQAHYWQYDICFDPADPTLFVQDSGRIYWLNITAVVADAQGTNWGWKSTNDHWNDDAVWAYWGELNWIDIWEPAEPLSNSFYITIDPTGFFVNGGGGEAYGDGWYYYPPEDWWNIWFYDHPLDTTRKKTGSIEFDAVPFDQGERMWLEVAVNWATDTWTYDHPDEGPPLPGVPEEMYIGRDSIFAADHVDGHYGPFYYEIPDYNPEWVSVDVRGYNFDIPAGKIMHTCRGSLDLAFVITGEVIVEDSGACCYNPTGGPRSECIYTTLTQCEQILGGVYQGDGVPCQGDEACCLPGGSCVMADALCCVNELGGAPQGPGSTCQPLEACCFTDGTCQDLDPQCCLLEGGTPQGAGSSCSPLEACCFTDGSCRMLTPECCDDLGGAPQGPGSDCQGTVACCLPDGTCQTVTRVCCDDLGGTPSPFGAPMCLGDLNGDGTDDACQIREDLKWRQLPDLDPTGIDVAATCPSLSHECVVLAEDFLCTQTGLITEIHIYGSWYMDEFPIDPGNVVFELSFHGDVPAGVDQPWSHPRALLWTGWFGPGQFEFRPYGLDLVEGYYDPILKLYEPAGDFSCWEYIFYLDEPFLQEGTEIDPVVYWLDVQAYPEAEAYFGWKTSLNHWNDDGVWAIGEEPVDPLAWIELRYPVGHPFETESIDLAFELYGRTQPCDCIPGDANNDGTVNVGDAVYIIAYVFKGGPPPVPYPICSGDANCDCQCNVGDAVYVISYVFKGGPPPCDCPTWLSICGPPLRK